MRKRIFQIPDNGLRPFVLVPDLHLTDTAAARDTEIMGARLLDLLDAAKLNSIAPLDNPCRGWTQQSAEIAAISSFFAIEPGLRLSDVLWTGAREFWNGEMARALAQFASDQTQDSVTGFVFDLADDVGPRGAISEFGRPIIPEDGVRGNFAAGGPFVLLLQCRLDALGHVRMISGFAQPILDRTYCFPVATAFERDILRLLLVLQGRLEDLGVKANISRTIDNSSLDHCLVFSLEAADAQHLRDARICAHRTDDEHCDRSRGQVVASLGSLADGRFLSELQDVLGLQ